MTRENPGASSDYSPNPWMQPHTPAERVKKPFYNTRDDEMRAETLIDDLTLPVDVIRGIRPRVGNPPFPPRTGYEQHQPTIFDVMNIGPAVLMKDTETRQESGTQGSGGPGLAPW